MTSSSMPWPAGPARISPLSLSRMRWKRAIRDSVLAEPEAAEPPHDDVLAGLRRCPAHQVADLLRVVANVGLVEQADLLEELAQLALDDLLDDVGGLALSFELSGVDAPLALDAIRRHVLAPDVLGARGRDLHGEIAHQLRELRRARHEIGFAVDLDQHADAIARVDVGLHQTLAGRALGALIGLGDAALAKRLDGGVEITIRLHQRLLALHHAGSGPLPELLHLVGCDHRFPPRVGTPAGARRAGGRWKINRWKLSDCGRGRLAFGLGGVAAERDRLIRALLGERPRLDDGVGHHLRK